MRSSSSILPSAVVLHTLFQLIDEGFFFIHLEHNLSIDLDLRMQKYTQIFMYILHCD